MQADHGAEVDRLQSELSSMHAAKASDKAKVDQKLELAMTLQSLAQSQGERVEALETGQSELKKAAAVAAAEIAAGRAEVEELSCANGQLEAELAGSQRDLQARQQAQSNLRLPLL